MKGRKFCNKHQTNHLMEIATVEFFAVMEALLFAFLSSMESELSVSPEDKSPKPNLLDCTCWTDSKLSTPTTLELWPGILTKRFFKISRLHFFFIKRFYSFAKMNRFTFPRHLTVVWRQISAQTNLIAGFHSTGIYPFNPDIIRAFVPNALPFAPSAVAPVEPPPSAKPRVDPVAQAVSLVKIEDILTSDMSLSAEEAHFLVDGLLQIINRELELFFSFFSIFFQFFS
jgi:hypothetical protein